MGFYRGPNIVRDNLVFAVDAGSARSYPGSGTNWYDLSGNGNNGTLTNGPTFSDDGVGSFFFDQSNDRVDVNKNGAELGIQDTAISGELVIKKDSGFPSNNFQGHIGFGNSSEGVSIKNNNPRYFVDAYNAADTRITTYFHSTAFGNTYQHTWLILCFTFAGETLKTYTNGEYYTYSTFTNGIQTIQDKNFNIAKGFGYYKTYGNIASIKLYNRELSTSEVLQNYNAQKTRFGL